MNVRQNLTFKHTERVNATVVSNTSAHSTIAASWRRSMIHHGLSPENSVQANRLSSSELNIILEQMDLLISVARPILAQLFSVVGRAGCCAILTDLDGVILDRFSNPADEQSFDGWNLASGTIWSETQQGTNGIGTCAVEERSILIHKDQHFNASHIDMTCMGSPIFDVDGSLIAVLDVSSVRDDFTYDTAQLIAPLVAETAARIETEYFRARFADATVVVADGYCPIGTPLLASNRDDLIIGANRAARKMLNLRDDVLSKPLFMSELISSRCEQSGLDAAERTEICKTIARNNGNMSAAAKELKVSRAKFYRLLKKHDIRKN